MANEEHEKLIKIAKTQRWMILSIGLFVGTFAGLFILDQVHASIRSYLEKYGFAFFKHSFTIIKILLMFLGCRLAYFLEKKAIGFAGILTGFFFPPIAMVTLLWLSHKSSKLLREEGYKVGFFGADIAKLEADQQTAHKYLETFR